MSSEEKLQQLFQAALKAPETKQPLARAFPTRQPIPRGTTPAAPAEATPQPIAHTDPQLAVEQPTQSPDSHLTTTLPNAGLDEQTSSELGKLLDEQQTRIKRKNRRMHRHLRRRHRLVRFFTRPRHRPPCRHRRNQIRR